MTRRMAAQLGITLFLGALVLSTTACVVSVDSGHYTAREEKRFEVTGVPDLTLTTFDGSMEIRSWERDEVRIEIEKRGNDKQTAEGIEVRFEQSGNRITVDVKKPSGARNVFGTSPSARIIATVPRRCNLLARSGDGSMTLERIEGRIEVSTEDGSLRGSDLRGVIRAHSGDGSIRFSDLDGEVDLDTGDGGATLSGRLQAVRMRTGDGTVKVRVEDGSAMTDEWEIRTGDGAVVLEVPEGFAADLDASAPDGKVRVEGFGAPERPERHGEGSEELKRPLGSGGKLLRLRSGSGSVFVRRL